jgi:hypothetical protein
MILSESIEQADNTTQTDELGRAVPIALHAAHTILFVSLGLNVLLNERQENTQPGTRSNFECLTSCEKKL